MSATMTEAYQKATTDTPDVAASTDAAPPSETTPVATETPSTSTRDDKGRFTSAAKGPPTPGTVPNPDPAAATPPPAAKAPATWTKDMQEKFATYPPELQAELVRREENYMKGIGMHAEAAKLGKTMTDVIAPFQGMLQSKGQQAHEAVRDLLHAEYQFINGTPEEKQRLLLNLARYYNVPLPHGETPAAAEAQAIDPQVSALQQQLAQITAHLQHQQLAARDQLTNDAQREVTHFASADHPHFEAVRRDMAALIESGVASSLDDAYERAVWTNPTTRAAVLAEQQAAGEAKKVAEAKEREEAAKKAAALNVREKPLASVGSPMGSMEDTMRAAYRRLNGG